MTLNRSFFGVDENDRGFNLDAAIATYQTIMKMDDSEAVAFAAMLAFESMPADIEAHRTEVDEVVKRFISKRLDAAKKVVPGDIAKAFDPNDYPSWERSRNARDQMRDARGRFRVDHRVIVPPPAGTKPIKGSYAEKLGIPDPGTLKGQARAQYQDAYLQVLRVLDEYKNIPGEKHIDLHWGNGKVDPFSGGTNLHGNLANNLTPDEFKNKRGLAGVSVGISRDWTDVPHAAFDVVGALGGSPAMANNLVGGTQGMKGNDFAQEWNAYSEDDAVRPTRFYRRLHAGSKLAEQTIGQISPKAKIAAQAGSFVGQHGPEAQKVLGPTADRAAYRYRGVERKPAEGLQRVINSSIKQTKDPTAARDKLIYGTMEDLPNGSSIHQPSPLINYFRSRLPKQELNTLQRKSGTIPPSEGVIINNKGEVVSQAVGFGEDWYLPFNLTNVGRMKGGEYIRTRTFGGPTTEDVYTGLVSGARAMTVVSHNGVYTVEFDDTFRGGRRFNDKAARMVARYGQLLDAVKSGEVAAEAIPRDVEKDIQDQAAGLVDPDEEPRKYQEQVRRLEQEWRAEPKMSTEQAATLPHEFLTNIAENVKTRSGEPIDLQEMIDQAVNVRVGQMRESYDAAAEPRLGFENGELVSMPPLEFNDIMAKEQIAARWGGPGGLLNFIHDTGLTDQYAHFQAKKENEFRSAYSPMRLDGEGYYNALQSLREQFPYYIASVHYEPWVQNGSNRRDSGYIKPRFTRPEQALSSYYDTSITGKGKISADQTRYQNWPVMQNRPVKEQETVRTDAAAAARAGRKAPDFTDNGVDAFMALVKHVKSQTQYGGGKGAYNASHLVPGNALDNAWGWVLKANEEELRRKYEANPADMKAKMENSLGLNEAGQIFNLEESKVKGFRNIGQGAQDFSAEAYRNDPGAKFNFGPEFEGGPSKTPASYKAVLDRSPKMAHARQIMAREHIEFDDASFYPDVDRLIQEALDKDEAYRKAQAEYKNNNFVGPVPVKPKDVDKDLEALVRLRRIGELHDAAMSAQQQQVNGNSPNVIFIGQDPNAVQPGFANNRTIPGVP